MLKIQESKRILDAGCGGGYLHQYLLNRKTQDSEIYAVDISPTMLLIAASRMDKFIKHAPNLSNFYEIKQEDISNEQLDNPAFKQFNYHLAIVSIEDLSQFQSDFFDTYFSNFVFNWIENPKLAYQEAFRVLKNGGRFGITVWGKKENCSSITFQQDALLELGLLKPEQAYSNFVEDKQIIIDQAKQAGFKNILCWSQFVPFDYFSVEQILKNGSRVFRDIISQQDEQTQKKIGELLQKKFDEQLVQKGEPFGLESLFLIGQK
ncbi:hypothetical protein pb186bvf_006300 [Paramecium bursaria]